ncbi:cytochrome P450 [Streptomyces huiliensis]|uniref:cytochrome P450 n=1 Tax=Streptomyces huiliensis TaxID=2876027 RepID=UPI001CBF09A2|nr:cytochrome P450 [Streptomyces huiliensis]MBZ4320316.1 cytochrome P450 [Streptomyces huiliensis]
MTAPIPEVPGTSRHPHASEYPEAPAYPPAPSLPPGPPPGCPAHRPAAGAAPAAALYGQVLTGDTHALYERLRREHGPVVPVELEPGVPAWLVIGYRELLEVTRNEECFSHDSRRWRALREGLVRPDSPLLPMMGYRPTVLFADGPEHRRLYRAVSDGFARLDQHRLRRSIAQLSNMLLDAIAPRGEADLLGEYALQLPLWAASRMLGLPDAIAPELIAAVRGMVDSGPEATAANQALQRILGDLVRRKLAEPGDDLTSWLLGHPEGLSPEEVLHHLAVIIVAGNGPAANWTAATVRLLLTDTRFRTHVTGGRLTVDAALDEVLWRDAPVQNFPGRYATRDLRFGGQDVREGDALLLGLAAANHDPAVLPPDGQIVPGNRSHLAFGAGPHTCPARDQARVIAHTAVDTLVHRLPDIRLAVPAGELSYRPSPWARALTALPVRFSPVAPSTATKHRTAAAGGPSWTTSAPTTHRPSAWT